jgi:hypothetical protein
MNCFFSARTLLVFALFAFAGFELSAQGALNGTPRQQMTRAALLEMGDKAAERLPDIEIVDLVNATEAPKYADGKFYLYPSEFYRIPADKQLHILRNDGDRYRILAEGTAKPKTPISRKELEQLSPEKRAAVEQSPLFEVVD